ncbi:hypothetical protein BsIDN1_11430 [Bacillus safensis]|uniref:Uncharacterized protein n=1 Tax=Bacillus safensis TaxID=561879 RepID=A0A5S9M408_BACIA|nr:hypothetical protein BsIDN1_11430 [Bacillus safensis]
MLDVETGKTTTLVKNSQDVHILSAAQPQFSTDGSSVYFLGVAKKRKKELKDDTGRKAKVRTIFFEYNMKKKQWKPLGRRMAESLTISLSIDKGNVQLFI